MRNPVVLGSIANCGHPATGNPRVLIQGIPASVILESTAGGPILGPGSPRVLVGGKPISAVGDLVGPHGDAPHAAPTILMSLATRVFVP